MNENDLAELIKTEPDDVLDILSTDEEAEYYNDANEIMNEANDCNGYDDSSQPWWKSWAVWLSIAGLISVLFSATGLFEKMGMTSDTFNTVIEAIGTILVAFGIVNNPTAKGRLS